jgi:U3 small nucleolar RNA-associated protein 20
LLDPFLPLLNECIRSPFDKVVIVALKCLDYMLKLHLPSVKKWSKSISKQLFVLFHKSSLQSELAQTTLKTLTVVIRDCEHCHISQEEQIELLQLIRTDLDDLQMCSRTFALLKAVVQRRFLHPLVYDIMKVLSTRLLLHSPTSFIRDQSQEIFLHFLLHYPLSQKRFQEHLDALIQALTHYTLPEGRTAVLAVLHDIFRSVPRERLDPLGEYFFLPLVLVLNKETEPRQRVAISTTIRTLVMALSPARTHTLLDLALHWLADTTQPTLLQAATLVIGLFLDVISPDVRIRKHLLKFCLETWQRHLSSSSSSEDLNGVPTDENSDDGDSSSETTTFSQPQWEQLYTTLLLFEKLLKKFGLQELKPQAESYWTALIPHLLHPHIWIRTIVARLFGMYFAQRSKSSDHSLKTEADDGTTPKKNEINEQLLNDIHKHGRDDNEWLLCDNRAFTLARYFCIQLQSKYLTPALGHQIAKNLLYISLFLHRSFGSWECSLSSSVQEELTENSNDNSNVSRALLWIVRRLSYMARKPGLIKRQCILQWFAALSSQLAHEDLRPLLVPMLHPLLRIQESTELHITGETSLRRLANEVMEMIKERAGHTEFFQAYETVRNQILELRRQRKARRERLPVISPQLAALHKLRRNKSKSKRKRSKKRKRFVPRWQSTLSPSGQQLTNADNVTTKDNQPPLKRLRTK